LCTFSSASSVWLFWWKVWFVLGSVLQWLHGLGKLEEFWVEVILGF
jgi:hypothetical protein